MKIHVPFETVAKSLFVAKDKSTDELKLVFYTLMKKGLFFDYSEIIFNSKPLNNEQLADLDFYAIAPFLNQLLGLIYASKDVDKLAFSKLYKLKERSETKREIKLDAFDEILAEVKIEREISHGLDLFFDDFEDLVKHNNVQPISHKSIISNADKYQKALAWALFIKDIEHLSFRQINDFVRTFLYSMSNSNRTNEFVFDVPFAENPRKSKLLLRLNTFEKIKLYFGALF